MAEAGKVHFTPSSLQSVRLCRTCQVLARTDLRSGRELFLLAADFAQKLQFVIGEAVAQLRTCKAGAALFESELTQLLQFAPDRFLPFRGHVEERVEAAAE